jgi:hypothetical protein
MDQQGGKQTSKSGNRKVGEHMNMAEPREKLAQKSGDITETPVRNLLAAITPNAKKSSKREQDPPIKSRSMRKKGLLKFFGEGPRVPASTTEGTLIKAVTKRREMRSNKDTYSKKRESVESDQSSQRKKTRLDDKELEKHEVNLKRMKKTPLKTKGKRNSSAKKKKKKKDTEKSKSPKEGEKKATFAEKVGKEMVEEKAVDYKNCMVSFAVRVDKGNNRRGGLTRK